MTYFPVTVFTWHTKAQKSPNQESLFKLSTTQTEVRHVTFLLSLLGNSCVEEFLSSSSGVTYIMSFLFRHLFMHNMIS